MQPKRSMPGGTAPIVDEGFDDRVGPRWIRLIQGYGDQRFISATLRLLLRPGPARPFSLSQLDDYRNIPRRRDYPWRPPLHLTVRARFSARTDIVGTAGFGFWNAPFKADRLSRGSSVPPQALWFFYASPPNRLALTDGWPGHGFFVQSIRSPVVPGPIARLGTLAMELPLLDWLATRAATGIVPAGEHLLDVDTTRWHVYSLRWERDGVQFYVDDEDVYSTDVSPRPPLGFVAWIDNQYASFDTTGGLDAGVLSIPREQWLDLAQVRIEVRSTHS